MQFARTPETDDHAAILAAAWGSEGAARVQLFVGIQQIPAPIGIAVLNGEPHFVFPDREPAECQAPSGVVATLPAQLVDVWVTMQALTWDGLRMKDALTLTAATRLRRAADALIASSYPESAEALVRCAASRCRPPCRCTDVVITWRDDEHQVFSERIDPSAATFALLVQLTLLRRAAVTKDNAAHLFELDSSSCRQRSTARPQKR